MSLKDQKIETKEKKTEVAGEKSFKATAPVTKVEEVKKETDPQTKKVVDLFKSLSPSERVAAYAALRPAINEDNDKLSIGHEADGSAYDNI